jgi:hypothetical protein
MKRTGCEGNRRGLRGDAALRGLVEPSKLSDHEAEAETNIPVDYDLSILNPLRSTISSRVIRTLEGMLGQKLVQHFSLPVSSSLVLRPTANTQIAMTRMTCRTAFPDPLRTLHPRKRIRYRCICVVL